VFNGTELNTTFYRSHREATYARWSESTGPKFQFAVKIPKAITHEARLTDAHGSLESFLAETAHLGRKRGPLLVQLPRSLPFDVRVADRFFDDVRRRHAGPVVCEPRHPSWFDPEAETLLAAYSVARAAADPPPHPLAGTPGGWPSLAYWRLHGSPRIYFGPYGESQIASIAENIRDSSAVEKWCIFDNTASGAATADALTVRNAFLNPLPKF